MLKFNPQKFFELYRREFGRLNNEQVAAIEFLLNEIEVSGEFDSSVLTLQKLAYSFATIKIETAHTFRPIHEYGTAAYFNKRYNPNTAVGQDLGNTKPGDGARFAGRGYVQLTGRNNYKRAEEKLGVDLINNPDLAMRADIAFKVAFRGMSEGWFTGRKFAHYFKTGKTPDYLNARRMINSLDRAGEIAQIAKDFYSIFSQSLVNQLAKTEVEQFNALEKHAASFNESKSPQIADKIVSKETSSSEQILSENNYPESFNNSQLSKPITGEIITGETSNVVEVEQVTPEKDAPKPVTGLKAYWAAAVAFVATNLAAVWQYVAGTDRRLVVTLVVVATLGAVIYFVSRYLYVNQKERREFELTKEREERAFQLQKITLESAMRRDLNTVRIAPVPIENSETAGAKELL